MRLRIKRVALGRGIRMWDASIDATDNDEKKSMCTTHTSATEHHYSSMFIIMSDRKLE